MATIYGGRTQQPLQNRSYGTRRGYFQAVLNWLNLKWGLWQIPLALSISFRQDGTAIVAEREVAVTTGGRGGGGMAAHPMKMKKWGLREIGRLPRVP